jgi:hypothetical protein
MKKHSHTLKVLLSIFCFAASGMPGLSANEEKSWLDELYEKGRQNFQPVRFKRSWKRKPGTKNYME